MDKDSWDSEFRAISLYRSMEHLASDIKNIKDSLHRMQKYILGKVINGDRANNIKDLEGIGKAVWEFIIALYKSHWDGLLVNVTNKIFKNNVKSKFSSQVTKEPTIAKDKNTIKASYISPLPPPILAKTAKKVNEISKYFMKNSSTTTKKLYAQILANSPNSSNIAREMLKIEEAFSKLQNKKIELVQKIISSQEKLKLKLNMTIKRLSQISHSLHEQQQCD